MTTTYLVQEFIAGRGGRWWTVRSFNSETDAREFAAKLGGTTRVKKIGCKPKPKET